MRARSLDALRGYAILTMVLSATIAFGILPGWMYHAQEPPPFHNYLPEISGITWVDLVFPFFLFAMGAAFPFSIGNKLEKGGSKWQALGNAFLRMLRLTFFAIFIQHFYPYMLSDPQDARAWGLAILCFALLFPMFMRIPLEMPSWAHKAIKAGAYLIATLLLIFTTYAHGRAFDIHKSNIIIILLANMAFFGAAVYSFTLKNWQARIAVMLAVAGIVLSAGTEDSWCAAISDFSPAEWMYHFDYLLYLLIVIPGSMAGDLLKKWMIGMQNGGKVLDESEFKVPAWGMLVVSVAIIIECVAGLYTRHSFMTMLMSSVLLLIGYGICRKGDGSMKLWRELLILGAGLLVVGLCMEPFQGGIKKDGPTFSYLLVTSGLGCMALIAFHVICDYFKCEKGTQFLVMSGQNPMVAYVAVDLLIYPVLNLCGLTQYMGIFSTNPWLGVLQGLILTSLALLVTMFFTRIKWFWRT